LYPRRSARRAGAGRLPSGRPDVSQGCRAVTAASPSAVAVMITHYDFCSDNQGAELELDFAI